MYDPTTDRTPSAMTGWMMPRVHQAEVTVNSLRSFVLAAIETAIDKLLAT